MKTRQWFLLNALTGYEADFDRLLVAGNYDSRVQLAEDFAALKKAEYLDEAWFAQSDDGTNVVAGIITDKGKRALKKWRKRQVREWVSASSYSE